MASRTVLHEKLVEILGSRNVYFQPPETLKMSYPCIVYNMDGNDPVFADNKKYLKKKSYNVTLIHRDPDNIIQDAIGELPYCSFVSYYSTENLNHYRFQIYF